MDSNKLVRVIEIGATHTRKADVAENGEIIDFSKIKTAEFVSAQDVLQEFIELVGKDLKKETTKIAYAVAGPVKDRRIIELLPNIASWPKNIDLIKLTDEKLKIPSIVVNDMEAAVTGMAHLLLEKENFKEPFWGITWSSGIGGRFWDGEKIVSDSEIGELSLDLSKSAPLCACGKRGSAQAFLSGRSMEKRLRADFHAKIESENKNPLEITNEAYLNKEDWAIDFYNDKAKLMGIFLASLVQIIPAERICFKGKVAYELFGLPGIKNKIFKTINKRVISPSWAVKEILLSPDGEKDALIGLSEIAKKNI